MVLAEKCVVCVCVCVCVCVGRVFECHGDECGPNINLEEWSVIRVGCLGAVSSEDGHQPSCIRRKNLHIYEL